MHWSAKVGQNWPASNITGPQIILIAAGSEIDRSWQKQLLSIGVCERSGVIMNWARSRFIKSRSVVIFTRSTTIPSTIQANDPHYNCIYSKNSR